MRSCAARVFVYLFDRDAPQKRERARDCGRLLTEDLQDGRRFGSLRVENPFR